MTTDLLETLQGNQLIAQFMGAIPTREDHTDYNEDGSIKYTPNEDGSNWFITSWSRPKGISDAMYKLYGWSKFELGCWCYDQSWDWLIPVVETICNIKTGSIKLDTKINEYWGTTTDIRIFRESMEVTYKEVVKFIQWYNENVVVADK